MKKKLSINKIFKTFSKKQIEVVTKLTTETMIQSETHMESTKHPILIRGYLISVDSDYYYLGVDLSSIDRAIKINDISYIQLVQEANPYLDVLNALPVQAQTQEEIN